MILSRSVWKALEHEANLVCSSLKMWENHGKTKRNKKGRKVFFYKHLVLRFKEETHWLLQIHFEERRRSWTILWSMIYTLIDVFLSSNYFIPLSNIPWEIMFTVFLGFFLRDYENHQADTYQPIMLKVESSIPLQVKGPRSGTLLAFKYFQSTLSLEEKYFCIHEQNMTLNFYYLPCKLSSHYHTRIWKTLSNYLNLESSNEYKVLNSDH